MTLRNDFDVVIVGAGITGLAAAHYAKSACQNTHPSRILILDQATRAGGKIRSEFHDSGAAQPFLLEWGADSFLSTKPDGLALVNELGLESELIETRRERQIFMLKRGKMLPMPEGLQLVVPKRFWPFMKSPLFSWSGKMRMAMDLFIASRGSSDDESMAAFIRRRLGQEALELLAEPILSGIYSADPERQSIEASFPQLVELERKHRSLIAGAWRSPSPASTGVRSRSLFVSFKGGMQTLVDALAASLKNELRLNTSVKSIAQLSPETWSVGLASGEHITCSRVIVTTPAPVSAHLLATAAPKAAALLQKMRQTSSGCAYLAYQRRDVPHALLGYGILIPKIENRDINAVTWVSSKMEGRAPKSHVLFRTFFGGERRPEMMQRDDDEIATIAAREIADLHGISAKPDFVKVFRATNGNPQYDVGHLQRVEQIEKHLPDGLTVTGCAMRGVGIPDCIRQGRESARQIPGAEGISLK